MTTSETRIYTGAEALALLAAKAVADARECRGGCDGYCFACNERAGTSGSLSIVAPDLAASVAHHEARAERAETLAQIHREERDACAAEVLRLRAIIEGRAVAPSNAEIAAHEAAGGRWRAFHYSPCLEAHFDHLDAIGARQAAAVLRERGLPAAWWALDSQRRPCAWPVAPEVPRG